jgi:hypothetical protein
MEVLLVQDIMKFVLSKFGTGLLALNHLS